MPNKTAIEWTDYTSNPIVPKEGGWGCSKVSPGCDHCYSERLNKRMGNRRDFHGKWEFILKERELEGIRKLKGHQRIFMCDMTDMFHSDVPWEFIGRVFDVMIDRPQHTFQLLTKRPGRMAFWAEHMVDICRERGLPWKWPPWVWAGTSVESQKYAPRLDCLARVPAKVRFVSVEPMLGPVELSDWLLCESCGGRKVLPVIDTASFLTGQPIKVSGENTCPTCNGQGRDIHWVIVGGESGPKARPMHPDWARSLRDQCRRAKVPYFHKQNGEFVNATYSDVPGGVIRGDQSVYCMKPSGELS